ncbi:hypothetical protein [Nocardioides dongkuii]|uniref:hypothetical protein n=1 Tax=Nocardioides dongkuii TaxID=2760089 RepID=UPI0015FCCECA|nr:hypothetical protein [Nocardioides dongkuii]
MTRTRVALAIGAAVLVSLAGAGIGWAVWGDDASTYRHALEKYGGEDGEANRYVDLEDGEAQLSIGSPDRHRVVVQWRDPDGTGWTAPETVWTDEENLAIDNTVRYGGGTVAILETFSPPGSEDDHDDITVGIVCRDLVCETRRDPGFGGEPQVTPDGSTAYLGQDERGVHLWTEDGGIQRHRWSGHPGYDGAAPSEPLLAPDGSLRVVSAAPARRTCRLELLVSEPGTADLSPVASAPARVRGGRSDCRTSLMTYSDDWVHVLASDRDIAADFWFVRDGEAWTTTHDDPSGLVLDDRKRGCCDTFVNGFVHWNDVAYGSPDGRRLRVQTHLLGEETWSEPQLLPMAGPGHECTWLDAYEVGDTGYVIVATCNSGRSRDEFDGDAYAIAATTDLRTWETAFVPGVRREPVIDDDAVRVGGTTWTPEDGFTTR